MTPLPATAFARRRRGRLTGALGALGVLTALCAYLLGTASPAAAHAVLTDSSPASGAVVGSAPEQVTLTFSESVRLTDDSVRVLSPDGARVDTGRVRDLDTGPAPRYGAPLRSALPDGTYTVTWQAVSADSHPISGAFTFSVGAPSETTVDLPEGQAGGGTVGRLYGVARYAAYAGFLLLAGGSAFVLACWPRGAGVRAVQQVVTTGWVGLTAATLAMLLLRAPYTGSGALTDVLDLGALGDVVGTRTGTALVSRLLLLAAAAYCTAMLFGTYRSGHGPGSGPKGPEHRGAVTGLALGGTVTAAGLATTWAASEHASTGPQTGVAIPVDVVHLLAVAAWLGGLATLAAALWSGADAVPRNAARRFSRVALGSVTVLAATGLYQSWRQVGTFSALTGTDYGRLLLLKVALVTALVALGWSSRRWTAKLSRTDAEDRPPAPALPVPRDSSPKQGRRTQPAPRRGKDPAPHGAGDGPERGATPPAPPPPPPHVDALAPDGDGPSAAAGAEQPRGTRTAQVGGPADTDPVRAAQLARQRQAVEAAQRRRRRDADPQRARLRRSVLTESAVAVVILAVATVLTGTEPARTAESGTAGADAAPGAGSEAPAGPHRLAVPFDTGGPQGRGTAHVTLDPGRTGRNSLRIRLVGPGGKPIDVPELKLSFTLPARDIGPLRVTPVRAGDGRWRKDGVQLPVPGSWETALTVRTSDIDQVTKTRTLRIR